MLRALVLAVVVVATSCTGGSDPPTFEEVHTPLPRIQGSSVVDGAPLGASELLDQALVINAWATDCQYCLKEQPALIRVFERYRDRGVSFLGIDHIDQRANARTWIEDFDVPYPSIYDPSGELAALLGYPGLPATLVVDRDGIIRFRSYGAVTEAELAEALDRVLAG